MLSAQLRKGPMTRQICFAILNVVFATYACAQLGSTGGASQGATVNQASAFGQDWTDWFGECHTVSGAGNHYEHQYPESNGSDPRSIFWKRAWRRRRSLFRKPVSAGS